VRSFKSFTSEPHPVRSPAKLNPLTSHPNWLRSLAQFCVPPPPERVGDSSDLRWVGAQQYNAPLQVRCRFFPAGSEAPQSEKTSRLSRLMTGLSFDREAAGYAHSGALHQPSQICVYKMRDPSEFEIMAYLSPWMSEQEIKKIIQYLTYNNI